MIMYLNPSEIIFKKKNKEKIIINYAYIYDISNSK